MCWSACDTTAVGIMPDLLTHKQIRRKARTNIDNYAALGLRYWCRTRQLANSSREGKLKCNFVLLFSFFHFLTDFSLALSLCTLALPISIHLLTLLFTVKLLTENEINIQQFHLLQHLHDTQIYKQPSDLFSVNTT